MYDKSKKMERGETSRKTKRVKSVRSLNNTSLGLQCPTKQSRKFHRVIVEYSAEENNLLSLGVCNPYHGKENVRTQLFNDSGLRRHKSLRDEMCIYFINLTFHKVRKSQAVWLDQSSDPSLSLAYRELQPSECAVSILPQKGLALGRARQNGVVWFLVHQIHINIINRQLVVSG